MPTQIDPNRQKPSPTTCSHYDTCYQHPDLWESRHADFKHVNDEEELKALFDAGAVVCDHDADPVTEIDLTRSSKYEMGRDNWYDRQPHVLLCENIDLIPPATPEEEADAMASIMEAFSKNRLS